jgi:ferrous iron transport protein B
LSKISKHIVLIGNPNSGKSTLFNALTGLNQKISNIPGTTVDKKSGLIKYPDVVYKITDLPGTYSIHPKSEDEKISIEFLLQTKDDPIDLILFVADASNLPRNLLLFTQVADLGYPTVLALNMIDQAEKKGLNISTDELSKELGVLIYPINAREEIGTEALKKGLMKSHPIFQNFYFPNIKKEILELSDFKNYRAYLDKTIEETFFTEKSIPGSCISNEIQHRFKLIDKILDKVQDKKKVLSNTTQKIDKILLHPVYGFIAFYATLFLLFQVMFRIADYPASWIESLFEFISSTLKTNLPDNALSSLLTDGILPGIAGILVFLPQIILLFAIIAILEDSGYMTRVSFITDRLMRKFGLNGKSVVPLIGGMACAIPSIMATRNIDNVKDRLITIMVTPLMSCSARLPVYTLLIGLFIDRNNGNLWYDARGLMLLGMYLIGFVAALIFALVFKLILKQKQKSFFILELPEYRKPRLKNLLLTIRDKANDFIFNAGKIIVVVSIVLWFLASYAPGDAFKNIDSKYINYRGANKEELINSEKLESSYAGHLGKMIEPAIRPLGYDWKIGIALITSFAAREVFTGTIATIYSVKESEDNGRLRQVLAKQKHPNSNEPVFSFASIISLLIFYAFAMQCVSTLAVTYRETKSLKWPIVQFLYMSGFAYLMSLIAYQLLK